MAKMANVGARENAHPTRSRRRPIDLVHLAKQSLGDPGLEEEILRLFDQMVQVYLQRVQSQAADGDDVLADLHALKGASMGVGAAGIVATAEAAEAEAREDGSLSAETLLDLGLSVEELRQFIGELLNP